MSSTVAQSVIAATIKEKLLRAIQGGEQDPNVLGHLFGLNGHDLVKNLEQLRKEGFISLKWGAGDRITRVWIPKGAQNMALLNGHVGEDKALHGDNVIKLSNAINSLPWDGEWRKWDSEEVKRLSGLQNFQVTSAMMWLREHDRIVQFGGGGRGLRIHGVRWRGEQAPETAEVSAPAESVAREVETAPEPAQSVAERFPRATEVVGRWKKMLLASELLKQTGNDALAMALGETEEWMIMALLGHELEALLEEVGGG